MFGSAACTGENAEPVDLDGSPTSTTVGGAPSGTSIPSPGSSRPTGSLAPEDQNAESRRLARHHAEQQCFDDPTAAQGIIRIVDPATDQVVSSVVVDCDEVRAGTDPESGR